jgi:hypothetical protein
VDDYERHAMIFPADNEDNISDITKEGGVQRL